MTTSGGSGATNDPRLLLQEREQRLEKQIAIVIPVYKHSILLFDAIASLVSQEGRDQCEIVIVDDGCPYPQTSILASSLPDVGERVHYIRHVNGGLSSARNRGIEFVLTEFPHCKAVYFLDADNMLSSFSLKSFARALTDYPNADWFYPDIRMFGIRWSADYSGSFRPLVEAVMNICEAGSLVHRRVFEAGVRFDETMRAGYEDWDFFLSAIERGFRGVHLPSSGFRYRKRAESMLKDSERQHVEIMSGLLKKHSWLSDRSRLVALEHESVPRYAFMLTDLGVVRLCTDPKFCSEELTLEAYEERFWAALERPNLYHAGAFLVVTTQRVLDLLAKAKLLAYGIWDLERRLLHAQVAGLTVTEALGEITTAQHQSVEGLGAAHVTAIDALLLREILVAPDESRVQALETGGAGGQASDRSLAIPVAAGQFLLEPSAVDALLDWCRAMRRSRWAPQRRDQDTGWGLGSPDLATVHHMMRNRFGGAVVAPILPRNAKRLAFVVPIFDFGGVEKVTFNVAQSFKALGYEPALVLLGSSTIKVYGDFVDVFEEIYLIHGGEFIDYSGPDFMGTHLCRWSVEGRHWELVNLLATFDIVLSCHSADALGVMAELRRAGVTTGTYLHLLEYTPDGRALGIPIIALAFEHALDVFVTCSHQLRHEMAALGVPGEKLVVVPNGSGFRVAGPVLARIRTSRQKRHGPALHALFLGRLDAQKGLDRLVAVREHFRNNDHLVIRVVGKAVTGGEADVSSIIDLVEPPVYDNDAISDLYEWADVLVLPSRYEGVPLSVIEAMLHGVVPIVTETGGVAEVVTHQETGFLIPQEQAVEGIVDVLSALMRDRQRLRAMSEAGASAAKGLDWNEAIRSLAGKLQDLQRKREAEDSCRLPKPIFARSPSAMA